MHNLYLGTAKNILKVWQEKGILRPIHYAAIQEKIDMLNVPYGVGRIPYKVSGITADQWKNWTNL